VAPADAFGVDFSSFAFILRSIRRYSGFIEPRLEYRIFPFLQPSDLPCRTLNLFPYSYWENTSGRLAMSRIPIGSQEAPAGIRNPHRSGGKRIISAQPLEGRGLGSSSTIPPVTPSGWKSGASGCGRELVLQSPNIRPFLAPQPAITLPVKSSRGGGQRRAAEY
jgi:hypothetical protein